MEKEELKMGFKMGLEICPESRHGLGVKYFDSRARPLQALCGLSCRLCGLLWRLLPGWLLGFVEASRGWWKIDGEDGRVAGGFRVGTKISYEVRC